MFTQKTNICAKAAVTRTNPSRIYLFKVGNGDIKTISKICSKLKVKTPEYVTAFGFSTA